MMLAKRRGGRQTMLAKRRGARGDREAWQGDGGKGRCAGAGPTSRALSTQSLLPSSEVTKKV